MKAELTPYQQDLVERLMAQLRAHTQSVGIITEIRDVLWPEGLDGGQEDSESWNETTKFIAALLRSHGWGPIE